LSYNFTFPDVGEGITEGELLQWLVKAGDTVKEDQIVAKMETDKAVVEIPSPKSGTVLSLNVAEGATVKVGEVMMVIGEKGEQITAPPPKKAGSVSVVGFLEEAEQVLTGKKEIFEEKVVEDVKALPRVRKLAAQLKVDLTAVSATGKDGQITEEDVQNAAKTKPVSAPKVVKKYDLYGYVEHLPLKGMRKTIAKNMVESVRETASVTHTEEVDISELVKIREKEKVKAAKEGVKLTYLPFVIKALIAGLKKHPYLNSSIDTNEEGSQEIILKKYYNIGVGVDTPDGLLVFVIKGADQKSMLQLGKEIEDLAEKARQRTIDIGDLKGGTFTITNYGSVGGLFGTPIINPGECAILGIGRIVEKPLVVHGEIQIRNVLPLSVTFDHRIVDGAEVARFVNTLMEHLEDPDLLLVE
jgi:pyruvate dehydrogenase E2 component (dihydrolipoamide acetyltransferase)